MGSPYVIVRILHDGPTYRRGAVLRVTAGQAHLWDRMGLAETIVEQATASPVEPVERAVAGPVRRRGRRGRRAGDRPANAAVGAATPATTEAAPDVVA